jgi:uncharacterized membrane protein YoaK (UPF0700 family)
MTTRASGKSARQDITETLWPRAAAKEDGLPPLLILLTIVTGVVDALAYLRLGHVFVANMIGNVVFLGFAAAGVPGLSVPGSLLALLPLRWRCRGAIRRPSQRRTAPAAQHRGHRRGRSVRGGDRGRRYCRPAPRDRQPLRLDRLLALGIQNATARRLAVADLTTTVLTLTLTGIAAGSRLGGASGARTARRVLAVSAMLLGARSWVRYSCSISPRLRPLVLAVALLAPVAVGARRRGTLVT